MKHSRDDSPLQGIKPGRTLEVPIDIDGWILTDGGTEVGKIEVASGEIRFRWSSSGAAWPSTFKLEKPNGHTVPTLTYQDKYEHNAFSGSAASHDVSGCDYKLVDDGNTIGWMKLNASNTEWYGVPAYVSGGYLDVTSDTLEFAANNTVGNQTAYKVTDDEL